MAGKRLVRRRRADGVEQGYWETVSAPGDGTIVETRRAASRLNERLSLHGFRDGTVVSDSERPVLVLSRFGPDTVGAFDNERGLWWKQRSEPRRFTPDDELWAVPSPGHGDEDLWAGYATAADSYYGYGDTVPDPDPDSDAYDDGYSEQGWAELPLVARFCHRDWVVGGHEQLRAGLVHRGQVWVRWVDLDRPVGEHEPIPADPHIDGGWELYDHLRDRHILDGPEDLGVPDEGDVDGLARWRAEAIGAHASAHRAGVADHGH